MSLRKQGGSSGEKNGCVFTAAAMMALAGPAFAGRTGRIALVLVYVLLALSILSLAGVILLFDPLFASGRIFGSLALGIATILAGVDARKRHPTRGWPATLIALGLAGIFLLPLWPLVYTLMLMPETAGAMFVALLGLGWLVAGYTLWWEKRDTVR